MRSMHAQIGGDGVVVEQSVVDIGQEHHIARR